LKAYYLFKHGGVQPRSLLLMPAGERAVLLAFAEKLLEDEIEDKKFQATIAGAKLRF
jgi:hypothetical protein